MKTYWHFAKIEDGRPVMRDGTPFEVGKEYSTDRAELCVVGYHGSERIIDALKYAPGPWVSKRVISGDTDRGHDKVCGTRCVHTAGFDATEALRKFARLCALDVIHLWDAPDVVVRYLKTGDDGIRNAAWTAARTEARAATWFAAHAHDAAHAVAWDVARAVAWASAQSAAHAVAWAVAWDVVHAVAWAVAWDVVQSAAWGGLEKKQNRRLTRLMRRELKALKGETYGIVQEASS